VVGRVTGLVSSISYESTRPFDKQLDDLSISLNEHSSLRDLLGQVKGTPVQVEVLRHGKRQLVEGTVIGRRPLCAVVRWCVCGGACAGS
jgi:hypothetical protein